MLILWFSCEGVPVKRHAGVRDESQQPQPLQCASPSDSKQGSPLQQPPTPADLQQQTSPVTSFPPAELFGSSFLATTDPLQAASPSEATAPDTSPQESELPQHQPFEPCDVSKAFFPLSGKVAAREGVGFSSSGCLPGFGVTFAAVSSTNTDARNALSSNFTIDSSHPVFVDNLANLPSVLSINNDVSEPSNNNGNIANNPRILQNRSSSSQSVTSIFNQGSIISNENINNNVHDHISRGKFGPVGRDLSSCNPGHVRSSSCVEGRLRSRTGTDPAAAGHVRTGSGTDPRVSSHVWTGSGPEAMTSTMTTAAITTTVVPKAPKGTVLKANNPFLSEMTPEELALANLDLSIQEDDLLNFCEIPSTTSERNKQASAQILQMFSTTAAITDSSSGGYIPQPQLPAVPCYQQPGYVPAPLTTPGLDARRPPQLPPKPLQCGVLTSDDRPPMLPPKPTAVGNVSMYPGVAAVYPGNAPVYRGNYHNISYGVSSLPAAPAAPPYDPLTLLRHQHLVQQQHTAEDWLLSQLPS